MSDDQRTIKRAPIVVVMGHVDHGKTSLLDYIRKSSVAEKESGGITQHIGAYEITHQDKKIVFLDTPGHEAFSMMRLRGSAIADIALLVVAADDGPKPQTVEAYQLIQKADIPFIVVLTKIDKPEANIEKAKRLLTEKGILLEGFGGNISFEEISSKTGDGVPELLDLIILMSEMVDLNIPLNPIYAEGVVIETLCDSQRGCSATLILKNGVMRVDDTVITATVNGKVKILEDFMGNSLETAHPSQPALVVGLDDAPLLGSKAFIFSNQPEDVIINAREKLVEEFKELQFAKTTEPQIINRAVKAIIKADVAGSLEALDEVLNAIHFKEIGYNFFIKDVGNITESDVKNAIAFNAPIFSFRVNILPEIQNIASRHNISIIQSDVIYTLVDKATKFLEPKAKEFLPKEKCGVLEILGIFGAKGSNQIIGGKVLEGIISNKTEVDIQRKGEVIGNGKIINLQSNKTDSFEVREDKEAGILFDSKLEIKKGDLLIQYKQ